jgi:hypothetical protein
VAKKFSAISEYKPQPAERLFPDAFYKLFLTLDKVKEI